MTDKHPYEKWLEEIQELIEQVKDMNFEHGTAEYYFKKNLLFSYDNFKNKL